MKILINYELGEVEGMGICISTDNKIIMSNIKNEFTAKKELIHLIAGDLGIDIDDLDAYI